MLAARELFNQVIPQERAMSRIKKAIVAASAAAIIAFVPVAPAAAYGHGSVPFHAFGFGHGLVGAVFGLAVLPLAIASAVISAGEQASPPAQPYGAPYGYAPAPSYSAPPVYYAPRPAYYPPAYGYHPAPRSYYAPRYNYAPRSSYAAGPGYRQRGYGYPGR
jgi:hypothetical protein